MSKSLRVLAVCTHNRTRSVLVQGLLGQHLIEAGVDARVLSVGTVQDGAPATDRTVRLLAQRGVDVRRHRSTLADRRYVHHADLIVCAEHAHVVWISGRHPGSFERCFTLPEAVRLGELAGPSDGGDVAAWVASLGAHRASPLDYLQVPPSEVGEIEDPTGRSPGVWSTVFAEIDDLTARLAALLA